MSDGPPVAPDRKPCEDDGDREPPGEREPDVVPSRGPDEEGPGCVDHGGERVVLGHRLEPAAPRRRPARRRARFLRPAGAASSGSARPSSCLRRSARGGRTRSPSGHSGRRRAMPRPTRTASGAPALRWQGSSVHPSQAPACDDSGGKDRMEKESRGPSPPRFGLVRDRPPERVVASPA
jgi:hypothetical protein